MNILNLFKKSKKETIIPASQTTVEIQSPINKAIPIQYFQLKEDHTYLNGFKYDKGRIFVKWYLPNTGEEKCWILATPVLRRVGPGMGWTLTDLNKKDLLEEIQFEDIQKLKPHWHKEFKAILREMKISF